MKIVSGKHYVQRNGNIVGPVTVDSHDTWPVSAANTNDIWRADGTYSLLDHESPYDLVAEAGVVEPAPVRESISDPDQRSVRDNIARRADEARITTFANTALQGLLTRSDGVHTVSRAWNIADQMEEQWKLRFGK